MPHIRISMFLCVNASDRAMWLFIPAS